MEILVDEHGYCRFAKDLSEWARKFHDGRNYDFLGGMTTRLVAIGAVVKIAMIFANIFPQIIDYWNFRTNSARCI